MSKAKALVCFFLFAAVVNVLSNPGDAEALVQEAWQLWQQNNQQQVEEKFLKAIEANPDYSRAYWGLAYLYQLQYQDELAWKYFKKGLDSIEDPQPYLFSSQLTPKVRIYRDILQREYVDLLEEITEKSMGDYWIYPVACLALGRYYQDVGDLNKAIHHYQKMNAITQWKLIGPFDNISEGGYDKIFFPEESFSPEFVGRGKNKIPVNWFEIAEIRHDNWIDFNRYFASVNAVYYGNTFVFSPENQPAQIRVGTSGSVKVFLNDEQIIACRDENNNGVDTYIAEINLQKGWNRLLIKCGHSEIDQCNFLVRITTVDGLPVSGIKVSTAQQKYISEPGSPVKMIPNFAESYFQNAIKENPHFLENYLFLADTYLRNDKAIEAELVLRDALKILPDCTVLLTHILEAYIRGEKYDEIATTLERIYSLDPDNPFVLDQKFQYYLENENIEMMELMVARLDSLLPESPTTYTNRIALYSKKNMIDKVLELVRIAYNKYQAYWDFAYLALLTSIRTTQSYEGAIEICHNFLKNRVTINALYTLADVYLRASNLKGFEEAYQKMLEESPASPGLYNSLTEIYFQLEDYEKAEDNIRKALELCPGSGLYWSSLAEIQRTEKKLSDAIYSYQQALTYNPTDYDSRDKLRDLQGKKSIYANFPEVNINSLIDSSSAADTLSEEDAVIFLKDIKRVVYPEGASESSQEILIKVYNSEGIDDFKEYWINYNSNTESLIIEKAVVKKTDGSEITADIDDNWVVFKSLEINDFIYLKWKIRNYYAGKLSEHFWDEHHFNLFYPVLDNRYGLLIPSDYEFRFRTQNMPETPALRKETEDGILYQWQTQNEQAVKYEVGMPDLDDIGKMLFISSIPDWNFMVEWYLDLAKSKTRSSYEISELVQNLLEESPNASERDKIQLIYEYITENIRYSSMSFRQSKMVPQKARDVLVHRLGDCKDMTTLAIAMFKELNIKAHYVLVNTWDEGQNRNILPSIDFNHCIAGIETGDSILYLDLTARHCPVGAVPVGDLDAFYLAIKKGTDEPGYLDRDMFMNRKTLRESRVEVHDNNGILVTRQNRRIGASAASIRDTYRFKTQKDREKELIEVLGDDFPGVKLYSFELQNLDELTPDVEYTYEFGCENWLSDAGDFKILKLPWTDQLSARTSLSYEERKYPYDFYPGSDIYVEKMKIILPQGYLPVEVPKSVKLSSPVADFSMTFDLNESVLTAERNLHYKKMSVSTDGYKEFKKFFSEALKADETQLLLKQAME